MKKIDLYKGHEGEKELILSVENKIKLHILSFHLDEILRLIPLSISFHKDSIMYQYIRGGEGWFDNDVWECKVLRVKEFYALLQKVTIDEHVKSEDNFVEKKVYLNLLEICELAIRNKSSIFISEE
ncbi:MAG: hypothetical protein ACPGSD_01155 [Flavobacteriales bacterium]